MRLIRISTLLQRAMASENSLELIHPLHTLLAEPRLPFSDLLPLITSSDVQKGTLKHATLAAAITSDPLITLLIGLPTFGTIIVIIQGLFLQAVPFLNISPHELWSFSWGSSFCGLHAAPPSNWPWLHPWSGHKMFCGTSKESHLQVTLYCGQWYYSHQIIFNGLIDCVGQRLIWKHKFGTTSCKYCTEARSWIHIWI